MADYDDDNRSGRTWTLVAAGVVVVLIAVIGLWVALSGDEENGDAGTGSAAAQDYIGPRAMDGGIPVGFAHTPAGSQAAAAAWVSYGIQAPSSRVAEGAANVFDPPELLGAPDPQDDDWFSITPVAVSEGVEGDAGVVKVLVLKSQLVESTEEVQMVLLEMGLGLEWNDEAEDWRITDADVVETLTAPFARAQFEGYSWLGPLSFQALGPLFP